jgi:hypothetical protein
LGDCLIWAFLSKITDVAQIVVYSFSTEKGYVLSLTKIDWATRKAIFKNTHLVTLHQSHLTAMQFNSHKIGQNLLVSLSG